MIALYYNKHIVTFANRKLCSIFISADNPRDNYDLGEEGGKIFNEIKKTSL